MLVYGCGNSLTFVRDDGEHYESISSAGSGVAFVTTCLKTQVVAYSEETLKPRIFGVEYPGFQVKFVLEGILYITFKQIKNGVYYIVKYHPIVIVENFKSSQLFILFVGGAELEYKCLSFSSDGKRLISLSGIPDLRLCVW